MADKTDRRCFLARGALGAAGIGAALQQHRGEHPAGRDARRHCPARPEQGAKSPRPTFPPGSLPCGKIGNVSLSRLFLGGNLIGGWAHSRDLMYASKLFTSYNTEAKIFETLELAQACGINTIQIDPACWGPVMKYNRQRSAKIQTMVCISLSEDKAKMNDDDQAPGRLGRHADLFARRGDRPPHDERRQDRRRSGRWST